MSLINDALKRARQAHLQRPPTPVPGLVLRPAEPPQKSPAQTRLILPVVVVAGLLLVGSLAWWGLAGKTRSVQDDPEPGGAAEIVARARVEPSVVVDQPVQKPAAVAVPAPQPPPAVIQMIEPQIKLRDMPPGSPPPANEAGPVTAAAAPIPAPAPQDVPLRLQAIVYSPSRPSALISGKTVFVGDRVLEWRVVAITKDTAVLTRHSQTNRLTLDQ